MKFLLGFISGVLATMLGIVVWGVYAGRELMEQADSLPPSLVVEKNQEQVTWDLQLEDLRTGLRADPASFQNKVVFLNFWEYWCSPCRREMYSLDKLYRYVNDSSIMFALVSTDKPDSVRNDKVLKEYSLPFFHYGKLLPASLAAENVPRTYILDKKGRIVAKKIGAANWNDRKVVELIDSLKRL